MKRQPVPPLTVEVDRDPMYLAVDQNKDIVISPAVKAQAFTMVNYSEREGVLRAAARSISDCRAAIAEGEAQKYVLYRCDEVEAYLIAATGAGAVLRAKMLKGPLSHAELLYIDTLVGSHRAVDDARETAGEAGRVHRAFIADRYLGQSVHFTIDTRQTSAPASQPSAPASQPSAARTTKRPRAVQAPNVYDLSDSLARAAEEAGERLRSYVEGKPRPHLLVCEVTMGNTKPALFTIESYGTYALWRSTVAGLRRQATTLQSTIEKAAYDAANVLAAIHIIDGSVRLHTEVQFAYPS